MAKVIINLTAKMAEQEIEKQLMKVPAPVLQTIPIPDLHHSLVIYVLKRLPNHYVVLEDPNRTDADCEELGATAENRSQIAALITEGIHSLLGNHWCRETAPQLTTSVAMPSSWFG